MHVAFGLDSFVVKGEAWRARGWCVSNAPLVAAELRADARHSFRLTISGGRDDGARHHAGFVGFGSGWPSASQTVALHFTYGDGSSDVVDVTRFLNRRRSLASVGQMLMTAWRQVRRGRHELLVAKLGSLLRRSRPKRLLRFTPGASMAPLSLVIDHDLGGGANRFSQQLLDDLHNAGKTPARLAYSISDLRFELHLGGGIIAAETLADIVSEVAARGVSEIHFNSSATFPSNEILLRTVRDAARDASAPIYFYVHDYRAVCPSFYLLDWRDRHCGVPSTETCNGHCLPQINNAFVRSQEVSDIVAWRREWEQLFAAAREIRFFSQVSLDLVRRAFPDLPAAACVVAPHRIEPAGPTPMRPRGVTVAVVGDLNLAKGARRVRELCNHIARTGAAVNVVIVGTIDEELDHPFVRMTGPYDSARLGTILSKTGAAVAFFPSIWPETFSYVVSELMQQQLPIVAFDIGAPAERLATYPASALLPVEAPIDAVFGELRRLALPSGGTMPARSPLQ